MLHILLTWPNSQPKPSGLYNKDLTQPCLDRKKDVPGTVVVVVDKHGEEKFTSASDTCCCGTTEKMTLDNIFWISSCTKMIAKGWDDDVNIDWAGILFERATGVSLNEYVHRNIFGPLELQNISMFVPNTVHGSEPCLSEPESPQRPALTTGSSPPTPVNPQ
ncbi:hypothetical protein DTO027B5_7475 [Paecilomyces variotii]|nr:hypothetical protein DTO169C6_764 [Paecilomyces variotii]KAJ9262678.1 hypothetical protein DTO195F2_3399 [Paecilomyces variotii]KAJ9286341.1 hypothetical protein DTO021C3_6051 [Paecilomyces variotii]KAJ9306967.1 hypothetical protein DTO217A2_3557 [Paecilomyces variotii]KAJ9321158.1 hypothetical protein DTO027B3_7814 [Paecilomyces variotii]